MADTPIDTSAPVLVTGATGYVAGWIVKGLLEAGATVHGAVRDPEAPKCAPLRKMAEGLPGSLRLFAADLLTPGAYAEAMAGCRVVIHTASPFTTSARNPQAELIAPAVEGTRNVLEEANRVESVARVVLTSSCAAIYTDAVDCARAPGGRLTEEVWNETASLDYQPYSYSKTLAEKAAWEIAEAQARWRLVVINPSLVLGPATHGLPTSESFNIVKMLGDGRMKHGAPRLSLGIVDVRDVAEAHLAAAFLPEAEGRHIVSGHETDLLEVAQAIHARFAPDWPVPHRALPKWLVWLAGPMQGIERRFVARNVDVPWRADNGKSRRALGVTYRPLAETAQEMFAQMVEAGAFGRR
ncbi:MAG: NAD-dependent epimerase/dehydratase family protein [Roseovarius sp.]